MERERKVWIHWYKERGPRYMPLVARVWLHVFAWTLRLEWSLFTKTCHVSADIGDTSGDLDALQLSIALPPIAVWFTIAAPHKSRIWGMLPNPGREADLSIHHWSIWFKLWGRWGEWRRADPWYVRGVNLDLADLFLGHRKYTTETIGEPQEVVIPLDGFKYEGTATFHRRTWKRPRWFAFVRETCTIDMKPGHGLPRAGKGENGWDCGDDAVCGWGVDGPPEHRTLSRAILHGQVTCLENRRRYGEPSKYGPRNIEPRQDEFVAQNAAPAG